MQIPAYPSFHLPRLHPGCWYIDGTNGQRQSPKKKDYGSSRSFFLVFFHSTSFSVYLSLNWLSFLLLFYVSQSPSSSRRGQPTTLHWMPSLNRFVVFLRFIFASFVLSFFSLLASIVFFSFFFLFYILGCWNWPHPLKSFFFSMIQTTNQLASRWHLFSLAQNLYASKISGRYKQKHQQREGKNKIEEWANLLIKSL